MTSGFAFAIDVLGPVLRRAQSIPAIASSQ
ncbi:Uncharacterised protein [Vibrio cholerae]|nr:Uncharacterised protein [Vibrio cholerae]